MELSRKDKNKLTIAAILFLIAITIAVTVNVLDPAIKTKLFWSFATVFLLGGVMFFFLKVKNIMPVHIESAFDSDEVQAFLEDRDFKRVSLVETYGGEIRCEVLDEFDLITHLGSGVTAVGIFLRLKARKEGVELPDYLVVNE